MTDGGNSGESIAETLWKLEHGHGPDEIAERLALGPRTSYLRDWVYGAIDGAITTFAIVAGVIGADLETRVVLILGACNILADGLSMAAANYSSTQTEIEEYHHIRRMEERHVALDPEGEREEVRQIFDAKGFKGRDLDRAVQVITSNPERWIDTMMAEEHGLPPITRRPWKAALATFAAFMLAGLVPVMPFALGMGNAALPAALVATGAVFFAIGSFRSVWSPKAWWRAGTETLLIGLSAAGVAFLAGDVLTRVL